MVKKSRFVLLVFLLLGCSSHPAKEESSGGQDKSSVKFELSAAPRQGFAPLHVSFKGTLEGVDPNDEKYYCLRENWDFGDGAASSEKPNCDPYGPDTKIKTQFFGDHTYSREGNYTIRLTLGEEGKEVIRSRQISLRILERDLQPGK
jgi:PKD repeat protein